MSALPKLPRHLTVFYKGGRKWGSWCFKCSVCPSKVVTGYRNKDEAAEAALSHYGGIQHLLELKSRKDSATLADMALALVGITFEEGT